MGTFYGLFTQSGEGCDYTIGCGMVWRKLRATTPEEAVTEAMGAFSLEVSDVHNIEVIRVVEVAAEIDLADEIKAARQVIKEERAASARAAKRAQIERLQRELDGVEGEAASIARCDHRHG